MTLPDLVMYDEEFRKIKESLNRLAVGRQREDRVPGRQERPADRGRRRHPGVDTTSLASLTAGNVAATDGLAKLIGEKEFSILFHEGEKDNIHISLVAQRVILVVIFDERSSLGLVRLRVQEGHRRSSSRSSRRSPHKAEREKQALQADFDSPFAEITDEDIDSLFTE